MQFKKPLFLFYFLISSYFIQAQINYQDIQFISPVDFPILLSGNYGELRSTHFHAGIDIKTGGVIGKKVYAVEDGYISRIRVSASSYGKTLYINHPNGFTTVYAHLDDFKDEISKHVKDIQYTQREFEINDFPNKEQFIVKKGDVIGFSGNTGSSSGPHIHFEIRKTSNQVPINPLLFQFDIKDHIAPVFYHLAIYPLDKNSFINNKNLKQLYRLIKTKDAYHLADTGKIFLSGNFGFGVEIYDYLDQSRNRCGIYTLDASINNEHLYRHTIDAIPFAEAGYIKSHMDYEEKLKSKLSVQKLFIDPNNDLGIYDSVVNRGIINVNRDTLLHIKIKAKDVYENESLLSFEVHGKESEISIFQLDTLPANLMSWNKSNTYIDDAIKVEIPERALYQSLNFEYSSTPSELYYSDIHHVHNMYTPLHRKISVSIKTKNLTSDLKSKAFIAQLLEDNKISAIGGEVINGYIVAETNSFGDYAVLVDTIPPSLELINKNIQKRTDGQIQFTIKDELSGIKSFNGFIDNNWALFEYDMKNDLLFYTLDEQKIQKNSEHELELFVIDNNDNVTTFYTNFYW